VTAAEILRLAPSTQHGRWMSEACESGLVSVIVPTFNRGHVLLKTLESVRAQRYRPVEVLLVDDGSTDGTSALVDEWTGADVDGGELRLRHLRQAHRGAPAARNLGLIESRGEFVQFLDSDDLLHPLKLQMQVERFSQDAELDFVYAGTAFFKDDPDWSVAAYTGLPLKAEDDMLLSFLLGGAWNTVSGLYRRRTCVIIGPWNERTSILQDREYNIRFILGEPKIERMDETLSLQRKHGEDRITGQRLSEPSLRGMYVSMTEGEQWIREAGRWNPAIEECFVRNLFGVAREAVLNGYVGLARTVVDELEHLKPHRDLARRIAVYTFLARTSSGGRRAARGIQRFTTATKLVKSVWR